MISATITLSIDGLKHYIRVINTGNVANAEFSKVFKLWAVRYRSAMQMRFVRNSKGGGDWPPLAASTRRKRGSTARASILRDTGTLFAALTPVLIGAPGQMEKHTQYGVEVGFGGPGVHPGGTTVSDIAAFHNFGAPPHLPQRRILWEPDSALLSAFAKDAKKELQRSARDNIGG